VKYILDGDGRRPPPRRLIRELAISSSSSRRSASLVASVCEFSPPIWKGGAMCPGGSPNARNAVPRLWEGGATTAISGGSQRQGIRTWHFLRRFECGASWTAVALYLPPKAELFFGLRGLGVAQPGRRVAAQGGGAGGGTPPPQRFLRSCWAGERASGPTRRAK
jgi:hypothetical protein